MSNDTNKIYGINGPVVTIKGATDLGMTEMVFVGEKRLVGEVIRLDDDFTTIQVYEDTSGLKPGEIVYPTGGPMCVTLGPASSEIYMTAYRTR
jgi:V/A-type H+-transporting ATPase subunit A